MASARFTRRRAWSPVIATLDRSMFSVRVLPRSEGKGEIIIGDFTERFDCGALQTEELDRRWQSELRRLVAGAPAVALVHDPRFAWVVYRDGESCFVRQVFARDGDFSAHLSARVTRTSDGAKISEWPVHLS